MVVESLRIQAARNITSNWFGLAVAMAVGLFLSPFILHKLGDSAFGLWILVFSISGYYGLFDLGIRSSIIKYVAKYAATRDYQNLARIINTSLVSYCCVALVLVAVSGVGSWYIDRIFRIAPGFLPTARLLFLMVGVALALGFPLSVFGGALQALQKYHWLNFIQVVSNLLRALLIVIALDHGRGLLAVALITVALPLIASSAYVAIVRRLIPVPFGRQYIDKASFSRLINYGAITFLAIVADKLRFQSDAMVIGVFLSATAITYFSIGSKLVEYGNSVVDSMADTFLPMSSHFDAMGDRGRMRELFINGNRACAMIIFPICLVFLILGKSIIEAWVGPKYVSSYAILVLLAVPRTLYRAQAASTRIVFGMAKHKVLALAFLIEGVANLALSVALIRHFGLIGEAVGTAIPLLCTSLVFLPYYVCRLLKVRVTEFLVQAYGSPLKICVPLVAVLLVMRHVAYAHNYLQLLLQLMAGAAVYGTGMLWFFFTREPLGMQFRTRLTQYVQQTFGA